MNVPHLITIEVWIRHQLKYWPSLKSSLLHFESIHSACSKFLWKNQLWLWILKRSLITCNLWIEIALQSYRLFEIISMISTILIYQSILTINVFPCRKVLFSICFITDKCGKIKIAINFIAVFKIVWLNCHFHDVQITTLEYTSSLWKKLAASNLSIALL